MSTINVTSAPKTATFQMRINPEVKQRVEEIYARQGLSFTDAVNIFIQQSLNMEGLPFLASPENADYSMTLATTPEPTVRPPSRIAKRRPCSRAMGVIRVISMSMLSPGMTISVPSGSLMLPVTSVVRK